MEEVVVQLVASRTPQDEASVRAVVSAFGARMEAQHPGETDPQLASFFTVRVPDAASARQLAARLQSLAPVDAAYFKPRASPA